MRNLEETFGYDSQNRLTGVWLGSTQTGSSAYDGYGRMTAKTAGGHAVFSNPSFVTGKPHTLASATTAEGVFPSAPQAVTYTGFDKVSKVKQGVDSICYAYGYDQQRTFMEEHVGSTVRTKRYVGNCEYITETNASNTDTQWLTYLSGPTGVYAVVLTKSGSDQIFYILKDNLGSWTTITDEDGTVEQRLSYDAWGNLRNPQTWSGDFSGTPMFDRGFTGHEHLYNFDLINMNGRMYDPVVSSFLSVDQYVSSPETAQGFNRYAYCMNNPLKYVDPSGWRPIGGSSSGYFPNTASNFDPYVFYGGRRPLEPRDLVLRQLGTTDPIITWMEENSLHGGGGGSEPIIDPSNLSPSQQKIFENVVSYAKENSSLFNKLLNCLINSEIVYTLLIGETQHGVPAQYNSRDNTIVFRDEASLTLFNAILEELIHAYQLSENKVLYSSEEFNYEFEAKVAAFYIIEQINGLHENFDKTNFEIMYNFISPNGLDVVFPTAQSIQEMDYINGYFEGARYFQIWNSKNNYGNENYRRNTHQTPKSLFELFKP